MTANDLSRLVALAAIWGASFLFFRMAVPSIGVAWFAELRVAIAALAMLGYVLLTGVRLDARSHWRAYLMMGSVQRGRAMDAVRVCGTARLCL